MDGRRLYPLASCSVGIWRAPERSRAYLLLLPEKRLFVLLFIREGHQGRPGEGGVLSVESLICGARGAAGAWFAARDPFVEHTAAAAAGAGGGPGGSPPPPPAALTLELAWSDVVGVDFRWPLTEDARLVLEAARVTKRVFGSVEAVCAHYGAASPVRKAVPGSRRQRGAKLQQLDSSAVAVTQIARSGTAAAAPLPAAPSSGGGGISRVASWASWASWASRRSSMEQQQRASMEQQQQQRASLEQQQQQQRASMEQQQQQLLQTAAALLSTGTCHHHSVAQSSPRRRSGGGDSRDRGSNSSPRRVARSARMSAEVSDGGGAAAAATATTPPAAAAVSEEAPLFSTGSFGGWLGTPVPAVPAAATAATAATGCATAPCSAPGSPRLPLLAEGAAWQQLEAACDPTTAAAAAANIKLLLLHGEPCDANLPLLPVVAAQTAGDGGQQQPQQQQLLLSKRSTMRTGSRLGHHPTPPEQSCPLCHQQLTPPLHALQRQLSYQDIGGRGGGGGGRGSAARRQGIAARSWSACSLEQLLICAQQQQQQLAEGGCAAGHAGSTKQQLHLDPAQQQQQQHQPLSIAGNTARAIANRAAGAVNSLAARCAAAGWQGRALLGGSSPVSSSGSLPLLMCTEATPQQQQQLLLGEGDLHLAARSSPADGCSGDGSISATVLLKSSSEVQQQQQRQQGGGGGGHGSSQGPPAATAAAAAGRAADDYSKGADRGPGVECIGGGAVSAPALLCEQHRDQEAPPSAGAAAAAPLPVDCTAAATAAAADGACSAVYRCRTVILTFKDPTLPHQLRKFVKSNVRLLKLYESGLPAWAVFMASYGLWYRPWFRRVTWLLFVLVSVVSMAMGFYDLYKNVPHFKQAVVAMFRPAAAVFEWLEGHTTFRLSVLLGYMLGKSQLAVQLLRLLTHASLRPLLAPLGVLLAPAATAVRAAADAAAWVLSPLLTVGRLLFVPVSHLLWLLLQAAWAVLATGPLQLINGLAGGAVAALQGAACTVVAAAQLLLLPLRAMLPAAASVRAGWTATRATARVAVSAAPAARRAAAAAAAAGGNAGWSLSGLLYGPLEAFELMRISTLRVVRAAQAVLRFTVTLCATVNKHRLSLLLTLRQQLMQAAAAAADSRPGRVAGALAERAGGGQQLATLRRRIARAKELASTGSDALALSDSTAIDGSNLDGSISLAPLPNRTLRRRRRRQHPTRLGGGGDSQVRGGGFGASTTDVDVDEDVEGEATDSRSCSSSSEGGEVTSVLRQRLSLGAASSSPVLLAMAQPSGALAAALLSADTHHDSPSQGRANSSSSPVRRSTDLAAAARLVQLAQQLSPRGAEGRDAALDLSLVAAVAAAGLGSPPAWQQQQQQHVPFADAAASLEQPGVDVGDVGSIGTGGSSHGSGREPAWLLQAAALAQQHDGAAALLRRSHEVSRPPGEAAMGPAAAVAAQALRRRRAAAQAGGAAPPESQLQSAGAAADPAVATVCCASASRPVLQRRGSWG